MQVMGWLIRAGVRHWELDRDGFSFLGRLVAHDNYALLRSVNASLDVDLHERSPDGATCHRQDGQHLNRLL